MSRARHHRPTPYKRVAQQAGATGLGAFTILVASAGMAQAAPDEVWDRMAICESGGDWSINTGNSFYGGLQFTQETWEAAGGTRYAERADLATREQQIEIADAWLGKVAAEQGLESAWATQWPACSAKVDVRNVPAGPPVLKPAPAPPVEEAPVPVEPPTVEIPALPEGTTQYIVQPGDTLKEIGAANGGFAAQTLADFNMLADADLIYPGQVLVLPPVEVVHTVVSGDTLSQIAVDYDACLTDVIEANRDVIGDNPDLIFPEERIVVVGGLALLGGPPVALAPAAAGTAVVPMTAPAEPTPSVSSTSAPFAHPVPERTRIGDGLGAGRDHHGQDFSAPQGTPVYAAHDGYVTTVRSPDLWNGGYGGAVYIEGASGTETRYAHLSATAVLPDTFVLAGEQIGWVGSTGDSTGPHLHFEVRTNGVLVEPLDWLAFFGIAG